MVDSARVDRTLAATRLSLRAPAGARDRIRSALAEAGHWPAPRHLPAPSHWPAPSLGVAPLRPRLRAPASGVSWSTAALLAGLTFVAGYWLRGAVNEPAAAHVDRPPPAARAEASTSESSPVQPDLSTLPEANGSSAPSASTPAEVRAVHDAPAAREAATSHATPTAAAAQRHEAVRGKPRAARRSEVSLAGSDEIDLLRRAERAIRSGEPELALSFLDELERRHPKTRLAEERSAARLMARCASADADASAQAAAFVRSHPGSVYSERLSELCGLALDASSRRK